MTTLKLVRKRGTPIEIPTNSTELSIEEPVSEIPNLGDIIGSLAKLEKLSIYSTDLGRIDTTESLEFLRGAKRLKFLALGTLTNLRDCSALADCKSLEWLVVARNVPFDFTVLSTLPSLQRLHVQMPSAFSVSRIPKISQLRFLQIEGGFKLSSLEDLAGLVNLETLRLWSGSLISTRGLPMFKQIQSLDIGYSKVRDTSDLGLAPTLKRLELVGNKSIASLEFLRSGDLEFLGLYEIPILESLKPLLRLSKLAELRIDGKIADESVRPLVEIPSLRRVSLPSRYKKILQEIRVDSQCVFEIADEMFRLTKTGPLILQTAEEAKEKRRTKLTGQV